MRARRIVNKLLETEEISDPKQYALSTGDPTEQVRNTLRDELVEKGWRQICVRPEEDDEWVLEAGFIDSAHRAFWLNSGARVAPPPTEAPMMKLMRLFKAAARRAGMNVVEATLEDVSPAYSDGYDLYSKFDDFEEDRGDWNVAIRFRWQPVNKFWSKASQALGYETQPYQSAVGKKAKASTATDDPSEIQKRMAEIRARHGGKDPEPETLEQEKAWRDEIVKPYESKNRSKKA